MGTLMGQQQQIERRKRFSFLGVAASGVLASIFLSLFIGVPLLVWGGYLGWNWFQYRAKRGMRF